MKYIDQINMKGKRVFIRVDFNVPIDEYGVISVSYTHLTLPTTPYV